MAAVSAVQTAPSRPVGLPESGWPAKYTTKTSSVSAITPIGPTEVDHMKTRPTAFGELLGHPELAAEAIELPGVQATNPEMVKSELPIHGAAPSSREIPRTGLGTTVPSVSVPAALGAIATKVPCCFGLVDGPRLATLSVRQATSVTEIGPCNADRPTDIRPSRIPRCSVGPPVA